MADKNLTGKIFDNIVAIFADVQKDISDAKNAIDAAGIPSTGSTKNLSEEISKIQTKVTETIKESGNIEGFGGGTMDIKDGFIIRKGNNSTMNANTTDPLTNNIDYRVPDNMSYKLIWPTNEAIKKDITDLNNLRYSDDEKIREKYRDLSRPLIKLHFSKNNTGNLANTSFVNELKAYDPNTYNGSSSNFIPGYDLEVYLTDNTISTSEKVSQELIDEYKLEKSEIATNDNILKYTGDYAMSLPAYDSKFIINGDELSDSLLVTDNFVVGIYPKVKATICKKLILHNDNLIIGRVKCNRGGMNMSTKNLDVYIDKDVTELVIDSSYLVLNYIAKPIKMKYALVGSYVGNPMINILVKKSDAMTKSIKAASLKLAPLEIQVYTYDRTEFFDFNRMEWIPTPGSGSNIMSWPYYLSDKNVDKSAIFYNDAYESNRYTMVNRFGLGIDPKRGNTLLDLSYMYRIDQLQDIVDKAKRGYIYQVGLGDYMYKSNTITLESPNYTWKPTKRLGETSDEFPKMIRNYFSIPEIDGVKTVTLDLSEMPGAQYGSQEFPLIGLHGGEYNSVLCRIVLAGTSGSSLEDKDFELLAAPGTVKFLDRGKNPITTITADRSHVTDDKYIVPIFYNKYITEVELTGCTIGKVTGSPNGVFVGSDDGEPSTPMIFKLHNCKYGDVYSGSAKDRNPEISPLEPSRANSNAKYVRFLIDESDTIVNDDSVIRLRLSFYNMDQTKKYNYSNKTWEDVQSTTSDNKSYRAITGEDNHSDSGHVAPVL